MVLIYFLGTGASSFSGDGGPATSASLNHPYRVFVDSNAVIYISDATNNRVRNVDTSEIISTIIGTGLTSYNGESVPGTACNLNAPRGIVVDSFTGDIYIASNGNAILQVMSGA